MATLPSSGETDIAIDADSALERGPSLRSRLGRLWQFPLLLVSLGLFGYAGYRFVDAQAGPTIDDRLASADALLANDRAEAATEVLRALLSGEEKKLNEEQRSRINLYLSRAIEQIQRAKKIDIPTNHKRIVEYLRQAERKGAKLGSTDYRRWAESAEALGKTDDALQAYRRAMAVDPEKALGLQRKVIDLLSASDDQAATEAELKHYAADARLSNSERSWALGEQSRLLADRGLFAEARDLLTEAIRTEADPVALGQLHYRLGYCQWKLGNLPEAERYLRIARDQLRVSHPQDADAALLLGQILQAQNRHAEANSFFQAVITSHPDSPSAPLARLGRGVSRIADAEDDAGLTDLHDLAMEIASRPSRGRYKNATLEALRKSSKVLSNRKNFGGALELMSLEQTLDPTPTAEFFARLSQIYERRADQLSQQVAGLTDGPEKLKKQQQLRELLTKAGDAAIANSRGLTLVDDRGYGEALWRGVELYDRAGSLPQVISALELFVAERPEDPLTPDALLRLGRTYHAAGQFDKAIAVFQKNQFRYPQSLAAQKSGVPLAKAYMAKGPTAYAKAEGALRATLESPLITPEAEEFRSALFELAELYYRTNRYVQAVKQLEELTERYPVDDRTGALLFLMADSYRKSAFELGAETRPTATDAATLAQQVASQAEKAAAKRDRLARAKKLYDRVLEQYRVAPPKTDLDKLYLKLAHFYRADCLYDNGYYEEAIRLYDAAALRYQDDPSALAAYVQIVNAYASLGRPEEAKAANERARWLLQRMPPESFKEVQQTMPQKSWDDWVKWSKTAGLW